MPIVRHRQNAADRRELHGDATCVRQLERKLQATRKRAGVPGRLRQKRATLPDRKAQTPARRRSRPGGICLQAPAPLAQQLARARRRNMPRGINALMVDCCERGLAAN